MPPEGKQPPVTRTIAGRDVIFDPDGFMVDPDAWDREVARFLAREDGLEELTEAHWRVLDFLRDFYYNEGRAPKNKDVRRGTGLTMLEVETMFPKGIKYGARRLAGVPNPRGCM